MICGNPPDRWQVGHLFLFLVNLDPAQKKWPNFVEFQFWGYPDLGPLPKRPAPNRLLDPPVQVGVRASGVHVTLRPGHRNAYLCRTYLIRLCIFYVGISSDIEQ